MYFAWLGHYTTALSIPAVVGIFFWVRFKKGVSLSMGFVFTN